jgi:hypothetical protein
MYHHFQIKPIDCLFIAYLAFIFIAKCDKNYSSNHKKALHVWHAGLLNFGISNELDFAVRGKCTVNNTADKSIRSWVTEATTNFVIGVNCDFHLANRALTRPS